MNRTPSLPLSPPKEEKQAYLHRSASEGNQDCNLVFAASSLIYSTCPSPNATPPVHLWCTLSSPPQKKNYVMDLVPHGKVPQLGGQTRNKYAHFTGKNTEVKRHSMTHPSSARLGFLVPDEELFLLYHEGDKEWFSHMCQTRYKIFKKQHREMPLNRVYLEFWNQN